LILQTKMNTKQLESILEADKATRTQFQGVYASDLLPTQVESYPSGYIANVDPSNKDGSHWVAFYFTNDGKAEFWDSYGQSPHLYSKNFVNFLEINSNEWSMNHNVLQSLDSSVCGEYCVYYLIHRCRDFSLQTIVNHFSNRKRINDAIVYKFVTQHYPFAFPSIKLNVKHQIARSQFKNKLV